MYVSFYIRAVRLDIIKVLSPTDAKENCFKRCIKIYIKTAPTCFDGLAAYAAKPPD